jgi:ribosomal protein L11 methyltransferase
MSLEQKPLCYELQIHVTEEQKDLVAALLADLEVDNFVYGDVDCDIEAEYDPSSAHQDLYQKLNANTPMVVYSEDKRFLTSLFNSLVTLFPKMEIPVLEKTFILQEIKNQNWRESWKESFQPVFVENTFVLLPPWEDPSQFSQKHKIVIDPGMAFGTGQHETTRLCLDRMAHFSVPKRFFDVGTGSGILAIGAKMLGAEFVLGNDIDPECEQIANENAQKNNVTGLHFVSKPISEVKEKDFDLVVANIQSTPLKTIVPEILKRVTLDGHVILSGILVSEKEEFVSFLSQCHAVVVETKDLNHWCAIVCRRA